jgi:hypothetical protein
MTVSIKARNAKELQDSVERLHERLANRAIQQLFTLLNQVTMSSVQCPQIGSMKLYQPSEILIERGEEDTPVVQRTLMCAPHVQCGSSSRLGT